MPNHIAAIPTSSRQRIVLFIELLPPKWLEFAEQIIAGPKAAGGETTLDSQVPVSRVTGKVPLADSTLPVTALIRT